MAVSEIIPVKELKCGYLECTEVEATHWQILVGFSGNEGVLTLPCKESAEACMKYFVMPFECGELSGALNPPERRDISFADQADTFLNALTEYNEDKKAES